MLNNEDYSKILKKPIKDMTIGNVVKYFDIICARRYSSDVDIKRTASELKERFIIEALYKSDEFFLREQQGNVVSDWYNKVYSDVNKARISLPSSYEITQSRNYLDYDGRPMSLKILRDRQCAKELKNLVREFCEDRDAGRLIHPSNGIVFDRLNGKTRLIIVPSASKYNTLWIRVIINGDTREFYVKANFKSTLIAYNWWKMYSRRITKKLGSYIRALEKGDYDE